MPPCVHDDACVSWRARCHADRRSHSLPSPCCSSQVWPPAACVAGSNDALELVKQGALNYTTKAGIPPEKMILGVPFYGFDYQCINSAPSPTMQVCQIAQVPYEGAPCSDAAGMPTDYDDIMPLLAKSSTGYKIDHASMTPWFNYIASDGSVHQVVYDDAGSLMLKYAWAKQTGFGGVGMWNIDSLNWESTDPLIHKQTMEMWNALAVFRNVTHTA
ncbi:MAG: hypothetical protein EOO65_02965 [Methanosarcinales archaeon]|nr:MAG: hypothetical protein EOO65_02965 [Methanosarcinales archaeon]